jgi:hypothetical protein
MDKSSSQVEGAVITFTAAATGGTGTCEYYFTLRNPKTGRWSVEQAYGGNRVWQWNTTGIDTGTYSIQVWARNAGSRASYQAWTGIVYTINPAPVTGVTVSMDKSSSQARGAVITFTAAASGGSGSYEYYFTFRNPVTGQWTAAQGYGGNRVWQWNTTGADPGTYSIQVWARSAGSTAAYQAWTGIVYTINPAPVTGVTVSMDKSSPQVQGAVITYTAAASDGSGSYEYIFWLWNPNTGKWSVGQAYSGNSVWQWHTAGIDTGTYSIQVWARNAGSRVSYEAWTAVAYTINPPP